MSFDGTWTSRRALILGMTNTDQVGMLQARAARQVGAVEAEDLGDVGDAGDSGGGEDDINPETGLTSEQEAEFEAMRTGEPPPAGDEPEGDDNDEPDAGDDATDPPEPDPAAALGRQKTPAELAAEAAAGKKPPPKTVNFKRHQRELSAAQAAVAAAKEEARVAREERIKLAERVSIINEAIAAQAAAQAAPAAEQPDPNAPPADPFDEDDIDPTEDYAASVQQLQRRQRFQREQHSGVVTQVQESREDEQLRNTFTRDFHSYAARPEGLHLPAAYQFLKDSRLTQISLSEFDKDPNDTNEVFTPQEVAKMVQIFNDEEKWLVGNAIKQRKSPAAAIMKQARVYGFKPPAAADVATDPAAAAAAARSAPAAATPPAARAVVPAVRPKAPAAPAVPNAAELLAEQALARENGKSLSDGGGAPPGGLTAELLLQLDDDEFATLVDDLTPAQLNALLGK